MNAIEKNSTTSQRLKIALEMNHLKQSELANFTGINKSTISRYYSGICEPKADAICKMASILRVSEMWLWGYDVPMGGTNGENNTLPDNLVIRMRSDAKFLDAVCMLDKLDTIRFDAILNMLSAMV